MVTVLHDSWTHKLARLAVRPLIDSPVTPNHLTTLRLLTGLAACLGFAHGDRFFVICAGFLWIASAFLDRADGELARLSGKMSRNGHLYDYACDVVVNGLVFLSIGIGLRSESFGAGYIIFGFIAGVTVSAASLLSERLEKMNSDIGKAYEGRAGFDFDDILYIFGPLAWLDLLSFLLIGAVIGGPIFAGWTWFRLHKENKKVKDSIEPELPVEHQLHR